MTIRGTKVTSLRQFGTSFVRGGGGGILLITIRTLAIRLTILAFMLMSGPWPKAPSCVDVEKPTVCVVVVSLGSVGVCTSRAGGDILRARNRSSERMAMALTMSVATVGGVVLG